MAAVRPAPCRRPRGLASCVSPSSIGLRSAGRERVAGVPRQLPPPRLGLGEVFDGVDAVLPADAAVAGAAERNMRRDNAVGVDPDRAGPQLGGPPVRTGDVLGPPRRG